MNSELLFTVSEFACTRTSEVIRLTETRTWGSKAHQKSASEQWKLTSVASVTNGVLTAVLSDDAETTGEDHPWQDFVDVLADSGVPVTAEELKEVPYVVLLSERLRDAISGVTDGGTSELAKVKELTGG